jgi:hypothetical protein
MKMSTLPIQAPHVPLFRPLSGLARVAALVLALVDVFAEAQQMARAAHKQYPFAEW